MQPFRKTFSTQKKGRKEGNLVASEGREKSCCKCQAGYGPFIVFCSPLPRPLHTHEYIIMETAIEPLTGLIQRLEPQIKSGQRKKALKTVEEGKSSQIGVLRQFNVQVCVIC